MQKIGPNTTKSGLDKLCTFISNFKNNLECPKALIKSKMEQARTFFGCYHQPQLLTFSHILYHQPYLSTSALKYTEQTANWNIFPQRQQYFGIFYQFNMFCVQRPLCLRGRVMWPSKSNLSIPHQIGPLASLYN